jgi:hypothetical protein
MKGNIGWEDYFIKWKFTKRNISKEEYLLIRINTKMQIYREE